MIFLLYYVVLYLVVLVDYSLLVQVDQVVPDRAVAVYVNEKYFWNVHLEVVRYGRRSPYYFNALVHIKHEWNNNVTFNAVFYEYLHNQYRRSFVEMHFPVCDLLKKEPYFGAMLGRHGIACPVPAKEHNLRNVTFPLGNLTYVWPFQKTRVQVRYTKTSNGDLMASGYFDMHLAKIKSTARSG